MQNSDEVPFNPFYIGPHPSEACAAPEIPGRQCSPDCHGPEESAKQAAATAAAALPTGQAGWIVGMMGPSGGATIFSTTEAQAAAAKAWAGKMECMQGGSSKKPGCE